MGAPLHRPDTTAQELMPQLYNMLVSPVKKANLPIRSREQFASGNPEDNDYNNSVTWETIRVSTTKQAHKLPIEVINRTCREKNSRGYIRRCVAIAAQGDRSSETPGPSSSREDDFASTSYERIPDHRKSTLAASHHMNTRNWRVKKIVDEHVVMMQALSKATQQRANFPSSLKDVHQKQRCTLRDRDNILMFQLQAQELLEFEYKILQGIRAVLR